MNLALSAFSIWKHFMTFNELEHWMERDLDSLFTCYWVNNSNVHKNECDKEVETLPHVLTRFPHSLWSAYGFSVSCLEVVAKI